MNTKNIDFNLKGRHQIFQFSVVGYCRLEKWLKIWVSVENNEVKYTRTASILTLNELGKLIDWLDGIAHAKTVSTTTINFIEPELSLSYVDFEKTLNVELNHRLKPSLQNHYDEDEPYRLTFKNVNRQIEKNYVKLMKLYQRLGESQLN